VTAPETARGLRPTRIALVLTLALLLGSTAPAFGDPSWQLELEGGPVWQGRNDVQIPNDATATRFSLVDVVGRGPTFAGRALLTWNPQPRHGLRLLLAPLTIQETGVPEADLGFAGADYVAGDPLEATYQFNSWRLGYRYRFRDHGGLRLWVGFTAKIRDAKVELRQGDTTSRDTDVGFVPLLHLAADWEFASRWRAVLDLDGLAGGPGRAFDIAGKLVHDLGARWAVAAGYRTIEGGADVEAVYNFAWLHYAVVSVIARY